MGYFIPYRYAYSLPNLGDSPKYDAVDKLMHGKRDDFNRLLHQSKKYQANFVKFNNAKPPMPRWQQSWFPRLDGAIAYQMVADIKPNNIIEVGSGHSTRFMAQAAIDHDINVKITAIDPAPRADISKINIVELINKPLQDIDFDIFNRLKSGDILFIDSSHILMPGSDVDILFNRILPILPNGIYIHIHDITLPNDYPKIWSWRAYNEQQAVISMILGGGYDLLWSSHYVAKNMNDAIDKSVVSDIPIDPDAFETSIWLKKT